MSYQPIESYGVIGDLHTVALVGMDGSIDWCCLPHFDSPSVFASILDDKRGGFFRIATVCPDAAQRNKQMYLPDTNVLVTRFLSQQGVGEVVDFMPIHDPADGAKIHQIVRMVRGIRGTLRFRLEWLIEHWKQPDEGVWEVRGGKQHFVYSKLQCWVALDRTIRLAQKHSLPLDHARFITERDRVYESIMTDGWHTDRQSFVQHYGSEAVDAANLIMPLVFFISPTDPRMLGTIDRIMDELVSDSLVYRYGIGVAASDGLSGDEGTFNMCTFWLVEALSRAGRLDDARFIFEKMLTYANHLGLYAEETGPTGEALGNYPQAFTHMGLISAAVNLDRRLGKGI